MLHLVTHSFGGGAVRFAHSSIVALATALAATLVLALPAAAQTADWQPGPGAILDNTYAGFIDVPASGATVPGSGAFSVAVGGLPGGSQTLNVYVHTGGKGWWFKSVTVNGGGTGGSVSAPVAAGG